MSTTTYIDPSSPHEKAPKGPLPTQELLEAGYQRMSAIDSALRKLSDIVGEPTDPAYVDEGIRQAEAFANAPSTPATAEADSSPTNEIIHPREDEARRLIEEAFGADNNV